jgi:hypothetical protein
MRSLYNAEEKTIVSKHITQDGEYAIITVPDPGVYYVSLIDADGRRIATKSVYIN